MKAKRRNKLPLEATLLLVVAQEKIPFIGHASQLMVSVMIICCVLLISNSVHASPVSLPPPSEQAKAEITTSAMKSPGNLAENQAILKPFVATYMITALGLEGINVTNSLSLNKASDNRQEYHFKSYSMSIGLLAFQKDETRDEQSKGLIHAGQIQPKFYNYVQIRDNETHRHVEIEFDWDSKEVINNHKHQNSKWSMSVPMNTIDKLSYQLSLMMKLASKPEKRFSFSIADGGRIKEYEFEILAEERVYTSLGSYKALKIHHQRYHKEKNITLWCAPELHYLPVKIIQEESGKPTFVSTLISYQEGMTGH